MSILLFSWLHFSCGRHCLVTACISTIKICSIVLYQMAPSTWKVQPRKRENHCSVPAAPQNSQQRNVDFVVFVAALFLWSSFPGSLSMAQRNARSDPPPIGDGVLSHFIQVFLPFLDKVPEPKGSWSLNVCLTHA